MKENVNFKIIKNFLPNDLFKSFQKVLFEGDIPWFWRKSQTPDSINDFYFTHSFYYNFKVNSDLFDPFIIPILKKLNAGMVDEVRANLLLNRNKVYKSNLHIDKQYKNCSTAILYMNTNNGYTFLQDENNRVKVLSEENKMLIFKNEIKHSAVSQTDVDNRIIININFLEKESF